MLNYTPGPTGEAFLNSTKFIKIIGGPIGSGKSTVALMDLADRAISQTPFGGVRRTKMIILRNTIAQLRSTIKPLLDSWFVDIPTRMGGYPMGEWRISDNTFEMDFNLQDGTNVRSDFILLAADTPDDVRRLLSVECSAAWCEEAREIEEAVFSGLQGRVARYPSRAAGGVAYPGVICSTNPPPLGGFWHGIMTNPPKNTDVFMQPPALLSDGSLNPDAENIEHLDPDYYFNLVSGKSDGWIDVYLKNQFGSGGFGNPVYKGTFKSDFHVAKEKLNPIMQSLAPLVIGMDNGLQAACVIGQQDMRGRVNILSECFVPEDQTMGVETFMDRLLIPLLASRFPQFKRENIMVIADPACWQRAQVSEDTIALAVQRRGFKIMKAPTNDPERRIGAVENLLTRQIDGKAGLLIDPSCQHIIRGFDWGYRYKTSQGGQSTLVPEKNHFSHAADAVQYFCAHFSGAISGTGAFMKQTSAKPIQKSKYVYA